MNKVREVMLENGENLSWCKPMKHRIENVFISVNEGEVVGIRVNGKDEDITDEKIKELAKKLNLDYDKYEGWNDIHILLESDFEELGCKDCPWFDICEAMDDEA